MELLTEAVGVLSPLEFKVLKRESGLTLAELSKRTGISAAQLCEYGNAKNGLRQDQAAKCAEVLLAAARERSMALAKLLAIEDDEMAAAS